MSRCALAAMRINKNNFILLEYEIPEEEGNIKRGFRVLAPVRNKLCEGIVWDVKEEKSTGKKLKSITKVIGDKPFLNEELLDLAEWISKYYLTPVEKVISLIFPHYIRGRWFCHYEVLVTPEELNSSVSFRNDFSDFIEYIKGKKFFAKNTVVKKFGRKSAEEFISHLVSLGYIKEKLIFREEMTFKPHQGAVYAELLLNEDELEHFFVRNKRSKKQIEVLDYLKKAGKPVEIKKLQDDLKVSRRTLKVLEERKAVKLLSELSFLPEYMGQEKIISLSEEQKMSIDAVNEAIEKGIYRSFLLYGVTGSGKTEVYVKAAEKARELGRQSIVIVPEIALTSQIIKHFYRTFKDRVVVLHSKLSDGERQHSWKLIKEGSVDVVIGTRSAIFAPVSKLGLIIIDEEHERSLKEESEPRYHARDAAEKRCFLNKAVLVLGSATPSLESLYRSEKGDIKKLILTKRVGRGTLPAVKVIDMREEFRKGNISILSIPLKAEIKKRLEKGEQIIAFLNRRGYASFIQCRDCGYAFRCRYCDVSLKLHLKKGNLKCHYCGYKVPVPEKCPKCGSLKVRSFGLGTEKVVEVLKNNFPGVRIVRMDSDTTARKDSHRRILEAFAEGKYDILVGTQMIAKGLDYPNVTLVAVIAADMGLNLPDFRAAEHTFQLTAQVAGRAGRGEKGGEVIIQTFNPNEHCIRFLKNYDFNSFYEGELKRRKELGYPPYTSLVRILFSSSDEKSVIQASIQTADEFKYENIPFMGPAPAPLEKVKNNFRWHIIVRITKPDLKEKILKVLGNNHRRIKEQGVNLYADVDPLNMF
ncbi:MAG TPA: primosomal protein N' [Peptococcaceae bacterium]|nr:MAG: Helicase PriA essential for oriC/DnaA-independent DNA replication [Clostridia bacterium 41_269]HBT20058.1 primosomal protein N' [Peptococcaceae bacterium]